MSPFFALQHLKIHEKLDLDPIPMIPCGEPNEYANHFPFLNPCPVMGIVFHWVYHIKTPALEENAAGNEMVFRHFVPYTNPMVKEFVRKNVRGNPHPSKQTHT